MYRIIRVLAPRRGIDHTAIRSPDGHLLMQHQQFRAIKDYFEAAFGRKEAYTAPAAEDTLSLQQDEIEQAISTLQNNKVIPPTSLPSELWRLCRMELSAFLRGVLQHGAEHGNAYPPEVSDCSLALLPKPAPTKPGSSLPVGRNLHTAKAR